MYGDAYLPSAKVVQIHSWASIFVALGSSGIGTYLILNNIQKLSLFSVLFGAFSNIVLNSFLIPHFGINGAAIATVISYSFAAYFCYLFLDRKIFMLLSRSLFFRYIPR
jgi:PST family polysaccharide transporter